jgi:hypothetical protein
MSALKIFMPKETSLFAILHQLKDSLSPRLKKDLALGVARAL